MQGDQVIEGDKVIQQEIVDIKIMNKTKIEVYREVLRDVSQNFEGAEDFIKQRIDEICEWIKNSVKEVFYFYVFFYVFSVIAWC